MCFMEGEIPNGNPSSMYDESHYHIRHQNNRIFIHTYITNIVFHEDQNPSSVEPKIEFCFGLTHHLVPDDIPQIERYDGSRLRAINHRFTQPLGVFVGVEGAARLIAESMLSNFRVPFGFQPEFGELYWGIGMDESNDRIRGFDGLVDRLAESSVRLVRQALDKAEREVATLTSVSITVLVRKRTIVEAEKYRAMNDATITGLEAEDELGDDDDDDDYNGMDHDELDDDDDDDEDDDLERFTAAVEMLETVRLDGEFECTICLKEELRSDQQVSTLPCSHRFHEDCVISWLRKSQTCPLCRFDLLKPADD